MNKTICYVSKFGSHQVMVPLGRKGRYKTAEYKAYEWELKTGLMKLRRMTKEVPVMVKMVFNVKGGVVPAKWRIKKAKDNKTRKVCKSKAEAEKLLRKNEFIEYTPLIVKFGATPDWDNTAKPIMDIMEDLERIPNDRYARKAEIAFTYGHKQNSVEIEVIELKAEMDNGIVKFKGL